MLDTLPLAGAIAVFALATGVVAAAGVRITRMADRIADRTGLGEAVTGALLLGMTTSLSGTVVSVSAALDGRASLAFANGVGGIAAQTAFLVLADLAYRRGNIEHAAADLSTLFQAGLLLLLLSVPMVAFTLPPVTLFAVHPASAALLAIYLLGVWTSVRVKAAPAWRPVATAETRADLPEPEACREAGGAQLALRFAFLALCLATAGWALSETGARIAMLTGLSETTVGSLMTAVATSLPELVTTLMAVRIGAIQLAVAGIIGGNMFDVLFLTLSDIAYRDGSLYHAVAAGDLFWLAVGLAMTAVLLLGLIVREKHGPAGIGFESVGILGLYLGAILVQATLG